jgi:hypothetical protein
MAEEEIFKDPEGSFTAGFLLTFGINLFICVSWIPMCGARGIRLESNPAGMESLGVVIALLALTIGISQVVHLIPTLWMFQSKGRKESYKGSVAAAKWTFVLWIIGLLVAGIA